MIFYIKEPLFKLCRCHQLNAEENQVLRQGWQAELTCYTLDSHLPKTASKRAEEDRFSIILTCLFSFSGKPHTEMCTLTVSWESWEVNCFWVKCLLKTHRTSDGMKGTVTARNTTILKILPPIAVQTQNKRFSSINKHQKYTCIEGLKNLCGTAHLQNHKD